MLFSSIHFLYYFLPAVVILYLLSPKRLKNTTLLISSLVFYGWGEPKYVFLMIGTIVLGYVFGLLIDKFRNTNWSKFFLAISVLCSVSGLLYFKYADFFLSNFNAVSGISVPFLRLALPIGISFYTFQILSYSVDVYRGVVGVQKNPLNLATYVTLFPQLIAGPIVRYQDVENQLTERTHSFEKTYEGIRRFVIGLSKKILIANTLGELCECFLKSSDLSITFYWIYVISYMLQIYFDFSGYSDMAIGLGKFFGFDFMENFNYPFISSSITEFWRRWHISLGTWFRDYVYIPLGGSRVNKSKMFFNIFVVWFLTGFWHGAEWNFVIWGLYFGLLLVIEKFFMSAFLKRHKTVGHIYVLFFVAISFMIFSASNLEQAIALVSGMFGGGGIPFISQDTIYNLKNFGFVILIAIIGSTPLLKKIRERLISKNFKYVEVIDTVIIISLLLICTAYLADGSFNPFLYFRF